MVPVGEGAVCQAGVCVCGCHGSVYGLHTVVIGGCVVDAVGLRDRRPKEVVLDDTLEQHQVDAPHDEDGD